MKNRKASKSTVRVPCGMCYNCEHDQKCGNPMVMDSPKPGNSGLSAIDLNLTTEGESDTFGFRFFSL